MSVMLQEAREAPSCVAGQFPQNQVLCEQIAKKWHAHHPSFVGTIARGSSDHAASFAKYAIETQCGLPTVSLAPSIHTLYKAPLQLKQSVVIAISQSGQSEDICESLRFSKAQGALTIALVNQVDSSLGQVADFILPLHAGDEKSVAATKSYITALSAILQLLANVADAKPVFEALATLPASLTQALECDYSSIFPNFLQASASLIVGRGFTFPIAQEAALKFKEVARIQAEAFSGAEVLHGPFALVKPEYPVLIFMQQDPAQKSLFSLLENVAAVKGHACVMAAKNLINGPLKQHSEGSVALPESLHPLCDPVITVQAFYPFVEKVSISLGCNPDQPENLRKVTSTI